MHVVDATLFFSPTSGGVKRYLLAKHAWMRAHTGWRHSIVVPGENYTRAPGDISTVPGRLIPGAFNYRLPLNPLLWARAIDDLEPDLIEVGDAFHPAWAAASVSRRRGIPLIAFYHSNFPQLAGRRLGSGIRKLIEHYVRFTYQRCDQVLAPSRYMCEYLHEIGVEHAIYQPLGVDVDTFTPERRGRDLRRELGLGRDTRLLAFAGRFSGEKNIAVLERAFALLGERYHLLLVGGAETARDGNITRMPYRCDNRELAAILASADALVHAGTHETFGLVVVEAMACGRPVVGARAGALPELIDDRVGLLATPHADEDKAAAEMAEAIAALYERNLDALGAAARAHVLANFSWPRALQLQMARYQCAIGTRRLPLTDDKLGQVEPGIH